MVSLVLVYQGALIVGDPVEDEGEDARLRGRHHFFLIKFFSITVVIHVV